MKPTGVIKETCSCGASIEMPATMAATVPDWRRNHLHAGGERQDAAAGDDQEGPDVAPATGTIMHTSSRFGWSR